jgi:hypothetical protein
MVLQNKYMTRDETWKKMSEYQFIISPYGNGYDCHRTWEAILLGCIPIVYGTVFNTLFNGLPVLQVNDWKDITADLLHQTANKYQHIIDIIPAKLILQYWIQKIKNCK